MNRKTTVFDAAAYLETEEDAVAYLNEASASGDAAVVATALYAVARARGMTRIARKASVERSTQTAIRNSGLF